jgi:transposase, IS30 family
MQAEKLPIEEIARALGKHRSTIYREVKRNTFVHLRQYSAGQGPG